jgi:alkanesulfonate monooxygenase SsuD/methylene tetrahydromethanopterin reductase-like flavin-dependent oxidoreductase (luciferase family)
MWSDDDGAYEGKHYRLTETLCRPEPVSQPRPRIMIGGGGERKTLRLVAQYADACNFFGGPDEAAHKIDVLRRHCENVGRDIREIEVTVAIRPDGSETPDDIVRKAEALGKVGVATAMVGATGDEPVKFLDTVVGPAVERVRAIEPLPL